MAPGPLSTCRGRGSKLMFRQGCKVRPAITASYSNAQLRVYTKLCSLVMLRYEASRPSHAIASGFTSVTNNASIDRADLEYCHLSTAGQRPADGAITAHQPATCIVCHTLDDHTCIRFKNLLLCLLVAQSTGWMTISDKVDNV